MEGKHDGVDHAIHTVLKDLSYAGLVIALSFEFVPAELVLPMAGYWVYLGDMKLWLAILAGTVGGTFGPLTLYALGRYGGRPMVEKYGKYFLIRPHHVDASDQFLKNTAAESLSMDALYLAFEPSSPSLAVWQR